MTLYKQIWLTVLTIALTVFCLLFSLGGYITTQFAKQQLSTHSEQSARYANVLLASSPNDLANIESKINTLLEGDRFSRIRFKSNDGQQLFEKSGTQSIAAPAWFTRLFPIAVTETSINVVDGNQMPLGHLELAYDTSKFHNLLWRSLCILTVCLLGGALLTGLFCGFAIRRLRAPFSALVAQAEAIVTRQFKVLPASKVPELQHVVLAMNTLVGCLKKMFEDEAERVQTINRIHNYDAVTGIANRSHFVHQLENALSNPEDPTSGILLMLRLTGLGEVDLKHGKAATDAIIAQIGQEVGRFVAERSGFCGRTCSTDFAICLTRTDEGEEATPKAGAEQLLHCLHEALPHSELLFHVGVTSFVPEEAVGQVLSRLDLAVSSAECQPVSIWRAVLAEQTLNTPNTQNEWRRLFEAVITHARFKLVRYPVRDNSGAVLHYECALRLQMDNGEWLAAHSFLGMASRMRMMSKLDLLVLNMVLAYLEQSEDNVAINFSGASLQDTGFVMQCQEILVNNPKAAARLWIEIPEFDMFRAIDAVHHLASITKPLHCKLGMEHSGHQFHDIPRLQGLGLDYIKVDGSFIQDIQHNSGNQSFLKGLTVMAHNLGALVIAENVRLQEEKDCLQGIGYDAYTGPGVQ